MLSLVSVNLATPATYHGVDMAAAGIATSITEALQLNPECRKTAMIVMMNMSLNVENLPHLQSCAPTIIDVLKNPNEQETVALPAWNFVGNLLQDTSSLDLLLKSGLSEAIVGGLTSLSRLSFHPADHGCGCAKRKAFAGDGYFR